MATSVSLGAVGDVAANHHGAFTRRQAASIGLTPYAVSALVRREVLEEPAPGLLFVRGSPASFERLASAASLLAAPQGAVGGLAAGWLHRLDGIAEAPSGVQVLMPKGIRLSAGRLPISVRVCRAGVGRADVVELAGIRCLGLARTICDLAGMADGPELERLIDDFERRNHSLTWLDTTAQRLQARGRRGPADVLTEIGRRRARLEEGTRVRGSWFQKHLLRCLSSPRIPGLVEEYEVRDERGRFVARCDLAIPTVRLAVEAHSRTFHQGRAAEESDDERDNRLAEVGWDVRYARWTDVTQRPERFRSYIERLVARRATDLGVTL